MKISPSFTTFNCSTLFTVCLYACILASLFTTSCQEGGKRPWHANKTKPNRANQPTIYSFQKYSMEGAEFNENVHIEYFWFYPRSNRIAIEPSFVLSSSLLLVTLGIFVLFEATTTHHITWPWPKGIKQTIYPKTNNNNGCSWSCSRSKIGSSQTIDIQYVLDDYVCY